MYLTYSEYTTMGGTLDQNTFEEYEYEASCNIDWYTFNRLQDVTPIDEKVKKCDYYLIKLAEQKSGLVNGGAIGVASESNDGVSVNYNVISANEAFTILEKEVGQTIKKYLYGVKDSKGRNALYRGVYFGEYF